MWQKSVKEQKRELQLRWFDVTVTIFGWQDFEFEKKIPIEGLTCCLPTWLLPREVSVSLMGHNSYHQ